MNVSSNKIKLGEDKMEMDYGYIYYVRNEINGMMYIGKVTSRQLFYWPSYKGSGVELQKAFKEFGRDNFSLHYLAAASNGEELSWLEKYYLEYYKIPNQNFYNMNLATSNSEQSDYYNKNNLKGVNLKNIFCCDFKNNITKVFNNITQFCKDNNFSRGCIFNVISGQRLTHKNCMFWYEDYPISDDAFNWILNYKNKTNYKTKYIKIEEVKTELNNLYKKASNKDRIFSFNGFYIESGEEVNVQWEKIRTNHFFLTERNGKQPIKEQIISNPIINTEKDNKFEKIRDTKYILSNDIISLYFNYDEINILTKIYPDINPRLLRQAINRKQKTVMSKKFKLKIFEGA